MGGQHSIFTVGRGRKIAPPFLPFFIPMNESRSANKHWMHTRSLNSFQDSNTNYVYWYILWHLSWIGGPIKQGLLQLLVHLPTNLSKTLAHNAQSIDKRLLVTRLILPFLVSGIGIANGKRTDCTHARAQSPNLARSSFRFSLIRDWRCTQADGSPEVCELENRYYRRQWLK